MKKIIFLTSALILICFESFCQLGVDVDLNTGSINSSISLWNVVSNDIKYPISINYNSQGIKVGQFTSNVGFGWYISNESFISRTVMGLPDDHDSQKRKGWLVGNGGQLSHNFTGQSDNNITNLTDEINDYTGLYAMYRAATDTLILDTEPDIFSINAPGLSTRFVFDKDGVIRTFPYQDLKIVKLVDTVGAIGGFEVTNNDGVKYTFDRARTLQMQAISNPAFSDTSILYQKGKYISYRDSISFSNEWFLTSILSKNGGEIDFSYTEVVEQEYDAYVSFWSDTFIDTIKYYPNQVNEIWEYCMKYVESNKIRLNTIETDNERLQFIDREVVVTDVSNQTQFRNSFSTILRHPLLSKINITAKGVNRDSTVQSYVFNYKKFNLTPYKEGAVQFFLQSIQTNSNVFYQSSKFLGYSFEYNEVDWNQLSVKLPHLNTDSVDRYGFHGMDGQWKFPKQYFYHFDTAERYHYYPILEYGSDVSTLSGNSQNADFNKISNGILSAINTSQGQSYYINYELNQFYDPLAKENIYGGGIRVKSLTVSDGVDDFLTTNYQYVDGLGKSTGTMKNQPKFAFTSSHAVKKLDGSIDYYKDLSSSSSVWNAMTLRTDRDVLSNAYSSYSYVNYSQVKVVNDAGSTVYNYHLDDRSNNTNKQKYALRGFLGASSYYYYPLGNIEPYDSYPFSPEDQLVSREGLLKSIKKYDKQDSLLFDQFFYYDTIRNITPIKAIRIEPTVAYAHWVQNNNTYDRPRDAFIYDEYTLETDSRYALTSEVSTSYDVVNKTVTKDFSTDNYGNLIQVQTTFPDGTISKNRFRYAYGLNYPSSLSLQAIDFKRMLTDGGYSNPIESVSTIKRPGGLEYLTGGQVSMVDWKVSRLFDKETFQITEQKEYANFSPIVINSSGDVVIDNSYEKVSEISKMSEYGAIENKHPKLEKYSSFLFKDESIIGAFSGAKNDQVGFSNFDNKIVAYHDFISTGMTYDVGRSSERSIILDSTPLSKEIISDGVTNKYVFSFWAKSENAKTVTWKVIIPNNSDTVSTIAVSPNSKWRYYENVIDISNLTHQIDDIIEFEISSSNLIIDDVALYPSTASLNYSSLKYSFSTASTNSYGKSTYKKYSPERVVTVDQDGNILSVDSLEYASSLLELAITWTGDFKVDESTIFQAQFPEILHELSAPLTFSWVITGNASLFDEVPENISYPSSSTSTAKSYTFTSQQDYVVFLKMVHLTKTYYKKLFISKDKINPSNYVPPPNIDLCLKGPTGWDVCEDEATGYSQGCIAPETAGGYTLKVNLSGGTGTYKFKWYGVSSPGSNNKTPLNTSFNASNDSYSVTTIPAQTMYYTVEVKDDQDNLITHSNLIEFSVIESDPNCPQQ